MKEQRQIGETANRKLLDELFGNQSGYLTKHWRSPTKSFMCAIGDDSDGDDLWCKNCGGEMLRRVGQRTEKGGKVKVVVGRLRLVQVFCLMPRLHLHNSSISSF